MSVVLNYSSEISAVSYACAAFLQQRAGGATRRVNVLPFL